MEPAGPATTTVTQNQTGKEACSRSVAAPGGTYSGRVLTAAGVRQGAAVNGAAGAAALLLPGGTLTQLLHRKVKICLAGLTSMRMLWGIHSRGGLCGDLSKKISMLSLMIAAAAGAGGRTEEALGEVAVATHGGVAGMGGGGQQGAGTGTGMRGVKGAAAAGVVMSGGEQQGTGTGRRGAKGGTAAGVRREVVGRGMGGISGSGSSVTATLAGVAAEAGAAAVVAVAVIAGRGTAKPQTSRHGCLASGSRRLVLQGFCLYVGFVTGLIALAVTRLRKTQAGHRY